MTTYRNRKLLDISHSMPCMATFDHHCVAYQGVEPAHSDSQIFGRGHGHKSNDWAFAAMCHNAHLDLDKFNDRDLKFFEWLRAYSATQKYLWENELIQVKKK